MRDSLPQIKISGLRKTKVVTPDMESIDLLFGEMKRRVMLHHVHFANGGGWSFFICPTCNKLTQAVRLYDGKVCCRRCDGLYWAVHIYPAPNRQARIDRLKAKLYGPAPHGKVKRRAKLEIALRKAEIRQRERALKSAARGHT